MGNYVNVVLRVLRAIQARVRHGQLRDEYHALFAAELAEKSEEFAVLLRARGRYQHNGRSVGDGGDN